MAQHRWRVALGVDADRDEDDAGTEVLAEAALQAGQPRRLQRAAVGAGREDEIDHDDLAAQVGQRQRPAVLGGQREAGRCAADHRQFAAGCGRAGQGERRQQCRGPGRHAHTFISRFSSLMKCQSVASASTFFGLILMTPASLRRSDRKRAVSSAS